MKAKLAFYKGKGDFTDRLIRWYTSSEFSHVEVVVGKYWYSTSPRDLKLRKKFIMPKFDNQYFVDVEIDEKLFDNWYFVDVEIDEKLFNAVFNKYEGSKYDWLGIFGSVGFLYKTKLRLQNKKKFFCSEFAMTVLGVPYADKYAPGDCYKYVTEGVTK